MLTKEFLVSNVESDLLKGGRKLNIAEDIPLGIIYNWFDKQIDTSYSNEWYDKNIKKSHNDQNERQETQKIDTNGTKIES